MNDVVAINDRYWARIPNLVSKKRISEHFHPILDRSAEGDIQGKLKKAKESYANFGSDEHPLAIYSIWGNSGIVITDRAIYGCKHYTFFKSKTHRVPLCDIKGFSTEDSKLTVDNILITDDFYLNRYGDVGEDIFHDYLRRLIGLSPVFPDDQLVALNDPLEGKPFVRALAEEGLERRALEAIIRTPFEGETILKRHGRFIVTEARVIEAPDGQQLRKPTDRFVIDADLSSPELIGQVRRAPHHPYVNAAVSVGKFVYNSHAKATHIAKIVGYTATVRTAAEKETQEAIIEGNKYGSLYLTWKPSEKRALLKLAAFFASVGVPTLYRDSVGDSLDE